MKPVFRPGEARDTDQIVAFQQAMALETENLQLDLVTLSKGVRAVFETPSLGQYYICEVGGSVVGSLMILTEWSDWRNGHVWWIHSLYIQPQCRGQRLFSEFFAYIKDLAQKQNGVRGLRLYVDKTNTKAKAVYERLGMNGDHYLTYELMWA